MADNILVTPGAGATVATDERTINGNAAHVQRVSHSLGPEGSHTAPQSGRVIGAGTDGAAYVDIRPSLVRVTQQPTVSTVAYSVGDAVGGLLTFANAARYSGGPVRLETAQLVDGNNTAALAVELYLFDRTVTVPTDNAALVITPTEMATCVAFVPFLAANAHNVGARNLHHAQIGAAFPLFGTSLFGVMKATAAFTLSSTSQIQVVVTLDQG